MPTRLLPALNSFDYEYLLYRFRSLRADQERQAQAELRRRLVGGLGRLAAAMSFLHDGTIMRGMQLELH